MIVGNWVRRDEMEFLSALALGVVSSLHCLSMCGNLLFTSSLFQSSKLSSATRQVLYQSGRLFSYVLTGALLAIFFDSFKLETIRQYAMLFLSAVLLLISLRTLGFTLNTKFTPFRFIETLQRPILKKVIKLRKMGGSSALIILGLLNGFMPCTPLQAAQLYAASTANPIKGSFVMFAFWLGTLPLLASAGLLLGKASARFQKKIKIAAGMIMLFMALLVLDRSLVVLGSNLSLTRQMQYIEQIFASREKPASGVNNKHTYEIKIRNAAYNPYKLTVPSGKQIELVIDRQENIRCSDEFLIPELNLRVRLLPYNKTKITLPPLEPGIYRITCQMYMMEGYLIVK